jgi:hypothetical protein
MAKVKSQTESEERTFRKALFKQIDNERRIGREIGKELDEIVLRHLCGEGNSKKIF